MVFLPNKSGKHLQYNHQITNQYTRPPMALPPAGHPLCGRAALAWCRRW
jgi:hypothetical protein